MNVLVAPLTFNVTGADVSPVLHAEMSSNSYPVAGAMVSVTVSPAAADVLSVDMLPFSKVPMLTP